MRDYELIIYRTFPDGRDRLLHGMAGLISEYEEGAMERQTAGTDGIREAKERLYECIHGLLELAGTYGFHGNLWHCYLTHLLVSHENSYSRGCEMRGGMEGTVNEAVLHDLAIFGEFFGYDFGPLCERLGVTAFGMVQCYESSLLESRVYNIRICERICELAEKLGKAGTPEEMKAILTCFYGQYGVGKFGLHKSFRIVRKPQAVSVQFPGGERAGAGGLPAGPGQEMQAGVEPILNITHVSLDDLVGYELQKQKLRDNTDAFVAGRKANNCLLFGDAGTGKSTCVKAIANEYYEKGLRVIEVYKHQFQDLHDIISQIKGRNYRFIIFMDDLSFEDFEIEYKYLKAVIEGGLEKKPENVLIYATSNRRHLIRENYGDKTEDGYGPEVRQDMHTSDTVQEKLSLAYRFGVTIYFGTPDKRQFQGIVKALAERYGVTVPEEELLLEANQWELSHGGLSGRTAQQFIDHILGRRQHARETQRGAF